MLNTIKEWIEKHEIKKQFLEEHCKYLPNYSPQGQPLYWEVSVYRIGQYDIYTGKQNGEYKISVNQKCPGAIIVDDNVYKYNIENKTLERIHGARWR